MIPKINADYIILKKIGSKNRMANVNVKTSEKYHRKQNKYQNN